MLHPTFTIHIGACLLCTGSRDPGDILKIDDDVVFWGGFTNTPTFPPLDDKRHAFFCYWTQCYQQEGGIFTFFNEELRAQMKLVLTLLRESLPSKQDLFQIK